MCSVHSAETVELDLDDQGSMVCLLASLKLVMLSYPSHKRKKRKKKKKNNKNPTLLTLPS